MKIKQPEDFISRHRTIKHNHLYLVDDLMGEIPYGNTAGLGLYHLDTRFLSCLEVSLNDTEPIPLLSSTEMGYMSTIVFTNGPIRTVTERGEPILIPPESIQLKRETVLYGAQFERYRLMSYNNTRPVQIDLRFRFDADFKDIFEIRDIVRRERPPLRPPILDGDGDVPVLVFCYHDRSGRHLQTGIRFVDHAPTFVVGEEIPTVLYRVVLYPRQPLVFNFEIQTLVDDRLMNAGAIEPVVSGMDEALTHLNFRARKVYHDMASFVSDNEDFNEMMSRNQKDIRMLMTHTDDGSYVAAGIPWYVALFGRDSLITSRFCLPFNPSIARESLCLLARYQGREFNPHRDEEPGKILHELRVGELSRLGEIPHTPYYGSVDSTPLWLITLYEYFLWTNDLQTLQNLWPHALHALAWIDQNLQQHPLGYSTYLCQAGGGILQQGWKDSYDSVMDEAGQIGRPPIALSEVQGYVYLARFYMAQLSEHLGEFALRSRLRAEAHAFRRRFNHDFWMTDKHYCALALDQSGKPFRVISSNPGHLLETGILYEQYAMRLMERLMQRDMFNGWGIRTLSSQMTAYNPMSYHNGSVWPHDNAIIARGFARYKRAELVEQVFNGLFEAARQMFYRRLPELFCGFRREDGKESDPPVRYAVACSPQAWSASAMYSLIQSMLNLKPNAQRRILSIQAPRLPASLNWLEINHLRVGDATVDLKFHRAEGGNVMVDVHNRHGALNVVIEI